MSYYSAQTFDIPELTGISQKTIEEHLGLYAGYVKNTNAILEKMSQTDSYGDYENAEMRRRFSFEFNGMRNHEYYFQQLTGGPQEISDGDLKEHIEKDFGSFEKWLEQFKTLASTRGVGWAILYYDPVGKRLLNGWVDEQHFGHLLGLRPVLALDMWEHSFVADYQPSGKKQYIEDYFSNLNWSIVEDQYVQAT